ncbi:probable ubiquitin-conjugating enzyme E2 24 isoform X1 [Chenopodium quinoa]|uniref:probable ubiquitin-conjugating enzyme E2 24 isoform X1 n=2 Tax=Chenopodium quinoa TaxID=63459 RepID=UPI000B76F511|nr:probable ubiquitin-conjugating enzyme E2 24 isoform X1 [Chenopodium quinoa]XP_021740598.1 probable ubiquitin-conjugating enzyme E2 24 isoform X1 [Chenopodium quinoa]
MILYGAHTATRIMAMELFGDSDVESFSETSSDDQDDIFSIYSGHAQSILSNLEDSIEKIDNFLSFERGFTHGDIVRSTGNPSGQMGKIVNIKMFVDLENVFGEVIKDVISEKLSRMRSILVGDYVIHGPWLGRVERVVDNVGIVFDDGTKCEIMATDQAQLLPLSPNLHDDSLYPYHPGQRVSFSHPTGSKSTGWLCGRSKKNQHEGTVFSVEVGLAYIDWISSAMVGVCMTLPPPTRLQYPKNLTMLSYISHANWQLGDWCVLPSETGLQKSDSYSHFEEIFSIVKNKIKVDVMWQDGSCSLGLDSQTLFPVCVLNAHDFFPEQFVLEKTSSDDLVAPVSQRWGVVKCVDANERTVKVKWETTGSVPKDVNEWKMEETVSAYELVEHPDFSFNLGDIVFLSEKNADHLNKMSRENWTTLGSDNRNVELSETQRKHFLSFIGCVVGFDNGYIKVEWASGVTEKVAPYKILRMEKDDGSVATHNFPEGNVAEFSDEMADYEKQSVNNQDSSENSGIDAVNCQTDHRSSRFFSLSQAAMGLFTSIAENFFRPHGLTSLPQHLSCSHAIGESNIGSFEEEDIIESCDIDPDNHTMEFSDFDAYGSIDLIQKVEKNSENMELLSVAKSKSVRQFKQFDIVGDCSGHHFADADGKGAASQKKKGWLKKIQQEWSTLEKDLPETIYVRIYEERMDLIRAAIVGAPGTPYHDGLFFFDILLPADYPLVPPMVHYHSGGLRLNPNLYESGKVCLSLLNTWTGTGSEVWNPGSSTILQVLLSLQALVLNAKPYFNEAGYDEQIGRIEGEKNSVSYNENAYLGTCKSMLYHLRRPPKHFEELVEEHFERRSQHILSACKSYMKGAPIGFCTKVENEKGNSMGFKIMLAKLFPKLVQAFSDKGIDCNQFIEPEK